MSETVGQELDLEVTNVAHGGISVARHEGRVIFVSDAIPGETVRARVVGIGEGFVTEPWWCRTLVLAAERTACDAPAGFLIN